MQDGGRNCSIGYFAAMPDIHLCVHGWLQRRDGQIQQREASGVLPAAGSDSSADGKGDRKVWYRPSQSTLGWGRTVHGAGVQGCLSMPRVKGALRIIGQAGITRHHLAISTLGGQSKAAT